MNNYVTDWTAVEAFVNSMEGGLEVAPLTKNVKTDEAWYFLNDVVMFIMHHYQKYPNLRKKILDKAEVSPLFQKVDPEGKISFDELLALISPFTTMISSDVDCPFPRKTRRNIRRVVHDNYFSKLSLERAAEASVAENTIVKSAGVVDIHGELKYQKVLTNNHKRLCFSLVHCLDLVDTTSFLSLGKPLLPSHYTLADLGKLNALEFAEAVDANDNDKDAKKSQVRAEQDTFSDKFNGCHFQDAVMRSLGKGLAMTEDKVDNLHEALSIALEKGLLSGPKEMPISLAIQGKMCTAADSLYKEGTKRPYQEQTFTHHTGGIVGRVLHILGTGAKSTPEKMSKICEMMFGKNVSPNDLKYRARLIEYKTGLVGKKDHMSYDPLIRSYNQNVLFEDFAEEQGEETSYNY